MPPTSTDIREEVRRRLSSGLGVALLAAAVAVPLAGVVAARGGSSGDRPAALAAPGADAGRFLPVRASRSGGRGEEPVPPPAVAVSADGATRTVFVAAATVGELLAGLGITLDADDEVTPPLEARPGPAVTVVRVDVERVTEDRVIPIPKERRDDPALPRGETRVEADGAPGLERVVFEIVRRDGRVAARRRVSAETVRPASPRVVVVGRGGGRGAPPDRDLPHKLRIATGTAGGSQEGGASWYRYKPGTCAHRTLRKGTVVTVTNLATGRTATCTVADRGPFIAGRIIDLDRSVFAAIADPDQGVVRVRIEW